MSSKKIYFFYYKQSKYILYKYLLLLNELSSFFTFLSLCSMFFFYLLPCQAIFRWLASFLDIFFWVGLFKESSTLQYLKKFQVQIIVYNKKAVVLISRISNSKRPPLNLVKYRSEFFLVNVLCELIVKQAFTITHICTFARYVYDAMCLHQSRFSIWRLNQVKREHIPMKL